MATNCRAKNPKSCRVHGNMDAIAVLEKEADNAANSLDMNLYMKKRAEIDALKEDIEAPAVAHENPVSIPSDIDWSKMSSEEATEIALQVAEGASDSDKTWRTLDFFNKMLVSDRKREAFAVMEEENITERVWLTWRKHHNALGDYTPVHVVGEEGWAVFEPAYRKMDSAHYAVKKEIEAETPPQRDYDEDEIEPWEDFMRRRHATKPQEPTRAEKALAKLKSVAWPPAWMD